MRFFHFLPAARRLALPLVCAVIFLTVPMAAALDMPGEAQLSADRMRFDSQSGEFLAAENVVIQSDGLMVRAPRGRGNVKDKEVHFEEGAAANGVWQGDWIDLAAGSISLFFAQTPTCIVDKGVKGDVGRMAIDADKLYMKGSDLAARNVRLLRDHETDVSFGADSMSGTLLKGVLTTLVAERRVWLKGRPNLEGEMVDIRADKAVYSVERGSIVLSGNVKAVQKGRTLTAQSLVYFPANNRIDAIGGMVLEGDGAAAESRPARITIDLNQEKKGP